MSAHNCKFCGKSSDIFTIEIPLEDSDQTFEQHLCGSCWEVIAEIVNRRINARIATLEAQVKALLDAVPSAKVTK